MKQLLPIIIPIIISATEVGRKDTLNLAKTIGVIKAASVTIKNETDIVIPSNLKFFLYKYNIKARMN
ncbi:hypothetical protein FC55_GL001432 [Ligilactobacillus salivarius DSM 20555 = ATCC 11741]|nr:hypothetical protein FC55_GL001432 [Ligilactobacillus salivarius DSM 20555 = ATCC 11741]